MQAADAPFLSPKPPRAELPPLTLEAFSGPLDLLFALIDRQKIDIYDIPIAQITEQYMTFLEAMVIPDMDLASDFLVMAASLLQIKSRLLLPKQNEAGEGAADPREELVLRLLEYRRCKLLAEELKKRQASFGDCHFRLPESASRLGLELPYNAGTELTLKADRFYRAAAQLNERNTQRYNDLSEKLTHILRREKVSLVDKLRLIWQRVRKRGHFFFNELFPQHAGKTERVTAILALLELLRGQRIDVKQTAPFAPMEVLLSEAAALGGEDDAEFSAWLEKSELTKPEQAYQN